MPTPTKPTLYPKWTTNNTAVRTEPNNTEKNDGFSLGFVPPAEWHNFLFGIISDWVDYLDYVTAQAQSAASLSASNVGHNIATGTNVQAQLDQLDAYLSALGIKKEKPGFVSLGLYTLANTPPTKDFVVLFINGLGELDEEDYDLISYGGGKAIQFHSGQEPNNAEQELTALVFVGGSGIGGGGGGGGGGGPIPVYPTVGAGDITNGYVTVFTPTDPARVVAYDDEGTVLIPDPAGAGVNPNADYWMDGNKLRWTGKRFAGLVEAGHQLAVIYSS